MMCRARLHAREKAQTLGDNLGHVNATSLVDIVPDTLTEAKANTL